MKLVLFDIDGTIMLSDGAGKHAIQRALDEVFGATGPDDHRFDGKTDPQIVRELMRIAGHTDADIDDRMALLMDRYIEYLRDELLARASRVTIMPGVRELLAALRELEDVVVGLLTGNLAAGAEAKLTAARIDPGQFRVGAYGSDHELRGELPAVAQRRARDELGLEIAGSDIVVIGDTPADLQCGRAIGARAIGVATGRFSVDDLSRYDPAAVFKDLSPTAAVLRVILTDAVNGGQSR